MESNIAEHFNERDFRVILLNWNDEVPIFDSFEYTFSVYETIGIDAFIGLVTATDLDAEDILV